MFKSTRNHDREAGLALLWSLRARLRDPRQAAATVEALKEAECRLFLEEFQASYAEFRENHPEEWAEIEREGRLFDGTLMDGLADE